MVNPIFLTPLAATAKDTVGYVWLDEASRNMSESPSTRP